jgi:hypothetical protein
VKRKKKGGRKTVQKCYATTLITDIILAVGLKGIPVAIFIFTFVDPFAPLSTLFF